MVGDTVVGLPVVGLVVVGPPVVGMAAEALGLATSPFIFADTFEAFSAGIEQIGMIFFRKLFCIIEHKSIEVFKKRSGHYSAKS